MGFMVKNGMGFIVNNGMVKKINFWFLSFIIFCLHFVLFGRFLTIMCLTQ